MKILIATGNNGENIYEEWMDHKFWRSPSNIIPQVEEKWDVQERDGRCDVGTGQRPNPW